MKLLKSILIPTLGISAIGTIAAVCTSCGSDKPQQDESHVVLTANSDAKLTFRHDFFGNFPDLQYSTDGKNWTTYSKPISITKGQNLHLKGNNPDGWSHKNTVHSTLFITGNVSISGNVMGLLDNGANPGESGDITNIPCPYCFYSLFKNSDGITSVSKIFLPATIMTRGCYEEMFQNCSSLTTAPELHATSLSTYCYVSMFQGCSSLSSIKIYYTGIYSYSCFNNWVNGVASTGTFFYNGSDTLADFGFPSGWRIVRFIDN